MSSPKSGKDRILDVARTLFAKRGYGGVSMRDIAKTVGMTQSSIYNHFDGKQSILVHLMVSHLEGVVEDLAAVLGDVTGPAARLGAFCDFHVLRHIDQPDDVFLAYMEIRSLEPEGRAAVMALRDAYEGQLRAVLEEGARSGEFKVEDVPIQTRGILAMLTGVTTWYRLGGSKSPEDVARIYRQAVLSSVGL